MKELFTSMLQALSGRAERRAGSILASRPAPRRAVRAQNGRLRRRAYWSAPSAARRKMFR